MAGNNEKFRDRNGFKAKGGEPVVIDPTTPVEGKGFVEETPESENVPEAVAETKAEEPVVVKVTAKAPQKATVQASKSSEPWKEIPALGFLDEYIRDLPYGQPITKQAAGLIQETFFYNVLSILNLPEEEFRKQWSALLEWVLANQDKETSQVGLGRHADAWTRGKKTFNQWRRLIAVVARTADPSSRKKELKNINFNLVLEHGYNARQRQNLVSFYGI